MRLKLNSVVMPLILINLVMFVLQFLLGNDFTSSLLLVSKDIWVRPWTIITSMFLHGNSMHILFNMYALYLFGTLIEQRVGKIRFSILYFVSGIVGAIAFSVFRPEAAALGASGAIMGVLGMTVILLPDLKVLFFFFIPMSMRTAGIIMALIDLFGLFPGVAGTAHLGGFACGIIYGLFLVKKKKKFTKKFSSKSHLEQNDIDEYLKSGRI